MECAGRSRSLVISDTNWTGGLDQALSRLWPQM